jgi:hypothetical protein
MPILLLKLKIGFFLSVFPASGGENRAFKFPVFNCRGHKKLFKNLFYPR